ncbi:cobalt ion-binding protein [Rhynchospora pubera]|uniref:Cobalt ion-binding protein n=1 Tax=Rhynchospora pubera TaxID=906938 RepID=A0AAV8C0H0_9POAL|nr:cobalt ion-binding protein [Rhynchospora pubera]KAJ4798059.1 cobalt ion-binding protein [Rhynchospora pubera]
MGSATTTFLSSHQPIRCAPRGTIRAVRTAPSFVSIRASASASASAGGDKNKSVAKSGGAAGTVPTSNYMVPMDKLPTGITRPLVEILRDLNKRVPDNIISRDHTSIPWYHANRMLSFYAPGWCGEVRNVKYSDNGSVTVVYRVTIRGTDGEAHREATGTVALNDGRYEDAVAAAEETAFCKACARFGFGLYLYHED